MIDEYKRGYVDALHFAAGVALALERMARNDAEALAFHGIRQEIDTYLSEVSGELGSSLNTKHVHLLAAAPELLATLKHILKAVEQGLDINPGLVLEYRFVVDRAEGKLENRSLIQE